MFQVSFSDKSAAVFRGLPQEEQINLLEEMGKITPVMLEESKEPLGKFKTHDQTYYRYRYADWRLYFTLSGKDIRCELIINKNTWLDFKVRSGLQGTPDRDVEANPDFLARIQEHK